MVNNKKEILFIATNIPEPNNFRGNKVILTIADNLSEFYNVSLVKPKVWVPYGLHFLKKYKRFFKLGDFDAKGFKVRVISYVELPGLRFTYWLFFNLPHRAKALFCQANYDLIHAHYGMPDGYLAYLLSKKYNVPYVLTLRNHDVLHLNELKASNPDYKKYLNVLTNASKVLVTNSNLKAYFNQLGIVSEVMPHGIDLSSLLHHNLPKKDTVIRISCVSNYLPKKNIEWVINAVLEYSGVEQIELSIAGDLSRLPDSYKGMVHDKVKMLGKLPHKDVMALLESSDIFALPSEFETFGLVYLEAAAKQNAIVGYKEQGVWGTFEDGKEMLFAKDYDDFKQLLYRAIENTDYRVDLQEKVWARVESLTWDKVSGRYQNVYSSILI